MEEQTFASKLEEVIDRAKKGANGLDDPNWPSQVSADRHWLLKELREVVEALEEAGFTGFDVDDNRSPSERIRSIFFATHLSLDPVVARRGSTGKTLTIIERATVAGDALKKEYDRSRDGVRTETSEAWHAMRRAAVRAAVLLDGNNPEITWEHVASELRAGVMGVDGRAVTQEEETAAMRVPSKATSLPSLESNRYGIPPMLTREQAVIEASKLHESARSTIDLDNPHACLRSFQSLITAPPDFWKARAIVAAHVAYLDAEAAKKNEEKIDYEEAKRRLEKLQGVTNRDAHKQWLSMPKRWARHFASLGKEGAEIADILRANARWLDEGGSDPVTTTESDDAPKANHGAEVEPKPMWVGALANVIHALAEHDDAVSDALTKAEEHGCPADILDDLSEINNALYRRALRYGNGPTITEDETLGWAYAVSLLCGPEPRALAGALQRAWTHDKPAGLLRWIGSRVHKRSNEELAKTVIGPQLRECLGRLVREVWVKWAQMQPAPKPSWLKPWEELSAPDQEVDRLIGEALFLHGLRFPLLSASPIEWPLEG